jgi:magnesium transporter
MFYKAENELKEIAIEDISDSFLTVGIVSGDELAEIKDRFGFSASSVERCRRANSLFRTEVEVYGGYSFTELRVPNGSGDDDYIALFLKKNLILIIDIFDRDGSTMDIFRRVVDRFPAEKINAAKVVCSFMESLVSDSGAIIENARNNLVEMEEKIVNDDAGEDFNIELLDIKKDLLKFNNYYEQLLDISETLSDNDNDIFPEEDVIYISNLQSKMQRIVNDIDSLENSADHLGDAYSSSLDLKLNHSMKFFTVLTTIFFPITIIVGWYGMNFDSMAEFHWKYGYVFVIALSVLVVTVMMLIGKKRRWF